MKLLRYGPSGHEKPGLLDRDGVVRDLSRELPDLTPEPLGADSLRGLDLVTTGTPPGVGMGVKPDPVFLRPGDLMRLGVERLGEQIQRVVAWSDR